MKQVKFELVVNVPNDMPVADAVEAIEYTDQIAGLDIDSRDIIWQDEDEPEAAAAAAYLERRGYELDMIAALQQ